MALDRVIIIALLIAVVNASVLKIKSDNASEEISEVNNDVDTSADAFKGVYTECFLYLSYSCLQKKTLLYLQKLNGLSEISVIGEYVKFVKVNTTELENSTNEKTIAESSSELLSLDIDNAVNKFFDNHILRFKALGKDIAVSHTVDEFVGRKKRKGGGGGGGGGHDDGKKKMMMMAMMCMKIKMMMMIPAMMGMMGMMSFKGMMFSMMSFMLSKMMLLMKLLEKKGGGGGGSGGGGGGDGWAAGGGGGGAWMPAGGQDYGVGGGGGGGGGYDANGQWQSRSIIADNVEENSEIENKPIISYVTPIVRYNNNANGKKPFSLIKNLNDEIIKAKQNDVKSRKKRGIIDVLQNTYLYWINQVLGGRIKSKSNFNYPKFKIINGVKYVYYPLRYIQKAKKPKAINNDLKTEELKTVITAEDFNKGEIVEGPVESRMHKKKLTKMKDNVNETMDDNPWE